MTSSTLPDIVFFAMQPWENPYPSPSLGLARALAVHTRVYYVSQPPTWRDALTGHEKRSRGPGVYEEAGEGDSVVYVVELPAIAPVNGLPPESKVYDFCRAQVDRVLNKHLRNVLIEQGVGDYIWINMFAPTQFVELDLHRPPLARYYYTIDAIETNWYTGRHGLRYEAIQCRVSDAVFGTSSRLGQTLAGFVDAAGEPVSRAVHVLPNAMAADIYLEDQDATEPADLADIPHPRVGFVGNLDAERIDYPGLVAFAKTRPDVHLVFVGPWNGPDLHKVAFEAQPNIHLLGRRDQRACPAYLRNYDICMIPFALNEQTASIYPLKINEYLAIGKPVLATPFSDDIQDFRQNITLAPIGMWGELVESTIAGHTDAQREANIARAADNTWAARATTFLGLVGLEPQVAPQTTVTP